MDVYIDVYICCLAQAAWRHTRSLEYCHSLALWAQTRQLVGDWREGQRLVELGVRCAHQMGRAVLSRGNSLLSIRLN